MCIEKNEEDFSTIHHELGHIFTITYKDQPVVFQRGANDGFMGCRRFADIINPNYLDKLVLHTS